MKCLFLLTAFLRQKMRMYTVLTVGTAGADAPGMGQGRHGRTPPELVHIVLHVERVAGGVGRRTPLGGETNQGDIGQGGTAPRGMATDDKETMQSRVQTP